MQRNLIDLSDDDPDPLETRARSAHAQPLTRAPAAEVFDPFAHRDTAKPDLLSAFEHAAATSHTPAQIQHEPPHHHQHHHQHQQRPPTHSGPPHQLPQHQSPQHHLQQHHHMPQPCVGLHGSSLPRRPSCSPSHTPSGLSPTASAIPHLLTPHTSSGFGARQTPDLVTAAASLRPASLDPLDAIIRQLPDDPLDSYLLVTSPTAGNRGGPAPVRTFHLASSGGSINDWDSLVAARTGATASSSHAPSGDTAAKTSTSGAGPAGASEAGAAGSSGGSGSGGGWQWHGGLSWPSLGGAASSSAATGAAGGGAAGAGGSGAWLAWPSAEQLGGAAPGQSHTSVTGFGRLSGTGLSPERHRPTPTLAQRASFSNLAAAATAGRESSISGKKEGGAGGRASADGAWGHGTTQAGAGAGQRWGSVDGRASGSSGSGGARAEPSADNGGDSSISTGAGTGDGNGAGAGGGGAGAGADSAPPCRELLIYAIPLIKDKLVFLPVTAWQAETVDSESAGVTSMVNKGLNSIATSVTRMWNGMREKDPSTFQHKIYDAGQKIIENMTAEERLMRNIPSQASKLVVYHPTTIDPSEVQEQLSTMTANYCLKSVGKAAVAGLALPVAVGLEIIAVPGSGWYALYQLYKNSVSAAGGQRLKAYLSKGADVRVNYAAEPRLDAYVERVAISPDGALTTEDIDDLCHDLKEDSLMHPLTELRNRYIRKHVPHNSDYALLPVSGADGPLDASDPDTPPGERRSRSSMV